MRLLPAVIFVVILFLAGVLFLQARRAAGRGGPSADPARQRKKALSFIAVTGLVALFGVLFVVIGKIALLVALVVLAIFFASSRKT
jgi:uncharacterized iron-regulated membrane protein